MVKSLLEVLKRYIKAQGSVTIGMEEDIILKHKYKISTGERVLRILVKKGFLEYVKNEKGVVTGHKWIGEKDVVGWLNEGKKEIKTQRLI